jgi:hypothetical protein
MDKRKSKPETVHLSGTPWERLDQAVKASFNVSKEDYLAEEARLKRARGRKKNAKKTAHR